MVRVLLAVLLAAICSFCDAIPAPQSENSYDPESPISLFTELNDSYSRGAEYVGKHASLVLKHTEIRALIDSPKEILQVSIPLEGKSLVADLELVTPFAHDFTVRTSSGQEYEAPNAISYRGSLQKDPESLVAFTISGEEVFGLISNGEDGNLVVAPWGPAGRHILYNEEELQEENAFSCASSLPPGASAHQSLLNTARSADPDQCVQIYLETSYSLFLKKNNDVDLVLNYVAGLFNQVATLFAVEGIKIEISELYIWTTEDPYNHSNSDAALEGFRLARPDFKGNLGHFLDFSGNNNGGRAYVDVLCSSSHNVGYSDITSVFQDFPTYSWTVNVIAHELGHGMGSHHTQDCVWGPEQCSPIDGCAEPNPNLGCGSCEPRPIPDKGTIMSYCHLEKGNGIDFRLGFGEEPGDLIRAKVASANCLEVCDGEVLGCHLNIDSIQVVSATCGRDNGSLFVHLSGSSGLVQFDIGAGPQKDSVFANLPPGQYEVKVSNDENCSTTAIANLPRTSDEPSIFATVTNSSCGGRDGVLELSTTEKNAKWYKVGDVTQQDSLFTDLSPGTYSVQLMNEEGCSTEKEVQIFEESRPKASISISATSCGLPNGAVEIWPHGGTAPFHLSLVNQKNQDLDEAEMSDTDPQVVSGLSAGAYLLALTDTKGCGDSSLILVDSSFAPQLSYDLIPAKCGEATGSISVLADQGRDPYRAWLNDKPVEMGVMVTDLALGSYRIMVKDSMDCEDTLLVDLNYDDELPRPSLPRDQVLCQGEEVVLNTGLADQEIEWTHNGNKLLDRNSVIRVDVPGVYEATVLYEENCPLRSRTIVRERPVPTTELNYIQTICAGDSVGIPDFDARFEYHWSNGEMGSAGLFPSSGSHYVTISDSGYCPQKIPFQLSVIEPVRLDGNAEEVWVCAGQEVQLEVKGAQDYIWSSVDSSIDGVPGSELIVAPSTDMKFIVEGRNQCFSDSLTFTVKIYSGSGVRHEAELFQGSTLDLPHPAQNVQWSASPGTICAPCLSDELIMEESGMLLGSYADQNGCLQTDTIYVSVHPLEDILPQLINVITPNNDGINDVLAFSGIDGFEKVSLEVFDQRGKRLYVSNDYENDWSGTYREAPLQDGVYFYLLTLVYEGRVFHLDSDLTIVRN